MKRRYLFSIICFLLLFQTQAQTEFKLKPIGKYTNGFAGKGGDLFEVGVKWDNDYKMNEPLNKWFARNYKVGARLPVDDDNDNLSRIDKSTDDFNLIAGIGWKRIKYDNANLTGPYRVLKVNPSIEWGRKKFEYELDSVKGNSDSDWKSNYAFEIDLQHFSDGLGVKKWKYSVQGRVRFSSSNKASDPINLLNTNTNIVNEIIVSAPKTSEIFSPAIGANIYWGSKMPISFSPVFFYYWENKDEKGSFEKQRFRAEQWLYFYPIDKNNIGLQFGIGLFQDVFTKSDSEDDDDQFGIAISIKTETSLFASLF